jgi:hypothetical protein
MRIVAALLLACEIGAAPSVPPILGSYACVTHDGAQTWHFTSTNTAWGAWLRAATVFAPQNGAPRQTAVTFVGFDGDAKRWNIVSLNALGSYYTRSSSSRDFNGSRWTDAYPADGATATIGVSPAGDYSFDLKTPKSNGTASWSHTRCTRVK